MLSKIISKLFIPSVLIVGVSLSAHTTFCCILWIVLEPSSSLLLLVACSACFILPASSSILEHKISVPSCHQTTQTYIVIVAISSFVFGAIKIKFVLVLVVLSVQNILFYSFWIMTNICNNKHIWLLVASSTGQQQSSDLFPFIYSLT